MDQVQQQDYLSRLRASTSFAEAILILPEIMIMDIDMAHDLRSSSGYFPEPCSCKSSRIF